MLLVPLVDNLPAVDEDAQAPEGSAQKASKAKNCFECRRAKVKCDRNIPCGQCVKKGRASTCPAGGRTTRPAQSEGDLQVKIDELTARIRDLESALAALQSHVSEEPHPLLANNQTSTEQASQPRRPNDPNSVLVNTYGSLITKEDGSAQFLGETCAVEWILAMEEGSSIKSQFHIEDPEPLDESVGISSQSDPNHQSQQSHNSPVLEDPDGVEELRLLYPNLFGIIPDPFFSYTDCANPSTTPSNCTLSMSPTSRTSDKYCDRSSLISVALKNLPSKSDAIDMMNTYYQLVAVDNDPVPRGRLLSDFLIPCYDNFENTPAMRRALALLYAVFALGTLSDPTMGGTSHRYISLSRVALMMDDVVLNATTTSIDTLILHILHIRFKGGDGSGFRTWIMLGQVIRLAQALGLHRDPSAWGLSPEETVRRRRTMWELVHMDMWTSLYFGRPPILSRQHFDVQLPMDEPDIAEPIPAFIRGKYLFSQQCLWPILDVALASKNRTTYAAVLGVDKRVRDWIIPPEMQLPQINPRKEQFVVYEIQRTMAFIVREIGLLYLHKPYLAAAVLEPPFEPLKGRYTRSVLAAYASACAILAHVRALCGRHPMIFEKVLLFANVGFTSVAMLGSLAATSPDCPLAKSALVEFDLSLEIYKQFAEFPKLKQILRVLLALRTKAHAAVESYKLGIWIRPKEIDPMVLQGLGGGVPLLHKNTASQSTPGAHSSSSPSSSSNGSGHQRIQSLNAGSAAEHPIAEGNHLRQSSQPSQTTQSADFEIFLENYLRSFDPSASNNYVNGNGTGDSSDYQSHSGMHIQTSEDFLHGVLTGDWGSFPRMGNNTVSSNPVAASFGLVDYSGVGGGLAEGSMSNGLETPGIDTGLQTRQDTSGSTWDLSSMSTPLAPPSAGHFAAFAYNPPSVHGQPTPSDMTASTSIPQHFYANVQTPPGSSSFQPPYFNASVPSHPNQLFTTPDHSGNIANMDGTSDLDVSRPRAGQVNAILSDLYTNDEQAAPHWDEFLRGFGTDR